MDGPQPPGDGDVKVEAHARSLFTFEFEVLIDGREVGTFRHKAMNRSTAVVNSIPHEIIRQGYARWDLVPEGGGLSVASVAKGPKGRYDIDSPRGTIALIRSFLGFKWELARVEGPVGMVRLNNLFSRSLTAQVPDDTPVEVAVMLMWTVVMLRRRAASAAVGGNA